MLRLVCRGEHTGPCTNGDRSHTRSLEANKSPANICRLPRRAGHFRRRVTDNSRPHTMENLSWFVKSQPISNPGKNDHHQATAATLHMVPAGRIPRTIMTSAQLLPTCTACSSCCSISSVSIWAATYVSTANFGTVRIGITYTSIVTSRRSWVARRYKVILC